MAGVCLIKGLELPTFVSFGHSLSCLSGLMMTTAPTATYEEINFTEPWYPEQLMVVIIKNVFIRVFVHRVKV